MKGTQYKDWDHAQLFIPRSSVSSFLTKDYQYAVKGTQYTIQSNIGIMPSCLFPVLVYPPS